MFSRVATFCLCMSCFFSCFLPCPSLHRSACLLFLFWLNFSPLLAPLNFQAIYSHFLPKFLFYISISVPVYLLSLPVHPSPSSVSCGKIVATCLASSSNSFMIANEAHRHIHKKHDVEEKGMEGRSVSHGDRPFSG